jgi:prevent-host-death family protein
MTMREVSASEFKAKCLRMLDEVDAEGIVITKRGKPVARLVPMAPRLADFIGMRPDMLIEPGDDHLSTGIIWEAELPKDPTERNNFIAARRAMRHPEIR